VLVKLRTANGQSSGVQTQKKAEYTSMLSLLQRGLARSIKALVAFAAISSAFAATNVVEYTYDAAGRIVAI
jgi:hypothetical protein